MAADSNMTIQEKIRYVQREIKSYNDAVSKTEAEITKLQEQKGHVDMTKAQQSFLKFKIHEQKAIKNNALMVKEKAEDELEDLSKELGRQPKVVDLNVASPQ